MKNIYLEEFEKLNDKNYSNREYFVKNFSWAIPDSKVLKEIKKYSPIIELGAGTGYWAALLQSMKCKIICFDKYTEENPYGHKKQWTTIFNGDEQVLLKMSPKMTLFLCWPPYDEDFAANCLNLFQGKYIIYIGESIGGCTANDKFFEILEDWNLINSFSINNWPGMDDKIYIYKRKRGV